MTSITKQDIHIYPPIIFLEETLHIRYATVIKAFYLYCQRRRLQIMSAIKQQNRRYICRDSGAIINELVDTIRTDLQKATDQSINQSIKQITVTGQHNVNVGIYFKKL